MCIAFRKVILCIVEYRCCWLFVECVISQKEKCRRYLREGKWKNPVCLKRTGFPLFFRNVVFLLYLCNDCAESFGIVDSKVCKHFTVDFNTCFVESTHKLWVWETFKTCSSIDTLNPQCAEFTFLCSTVSESVGQTFFIGIFGNGPNVFARAKITSGFL